MNILAECSLLPDFMAAPRLKVPIGPRGGVSRQVIVECQGFRIKHLSRIEPDELCPKG